MAENLPSPRMHRLAVEAGNTASYYRTSMRLSVMTTVLAVADVLWLHGPASDQFGWRMLDLAALIPASWWKSRRWRQRADWYATTPGWWRRLDEAPETRPFPTSFYELMDRPTPIRIPRWMLALRRRFGQ